MDVQESRLLLARFIVRDFKKEFQEKEKEKKKFFKGSTKKHG